MKLRDIREFAKMLGVEENNGRKKQDIIRNIQVYEGYEPCYRTKDVCEYECLWKKDCMNGR